MVDIYILALLGHLIGDWIVQTDYQAAMKTESWLAMARHIFSYHVTLGVCLGFVLPFADLLILLIISATTHAFLDRRWPVRWLLSRTGSPQFAESLLGVLMADQILHISIIWLTLVLL